MNWCTSTVLAFAANDFGGQEPGTDGEIAEFCSTSYAVTFPVMSKISVLGEDQHPIYAPLTRAVPTADGKPRCAMCFVATG